MNFHDFLSSFGWIMFFGTLAVSGWYFITRGEKETLPDGTVKKTGKIFKDWYFFWTQTKGVKKIYYQNDQLFYLLMDYLSYYPANDYGLVPETGNKASLKFKNEMFAKKFESDIEKIKTDLQVEVLLKGDYVSFYKEYDEYVYPEWVRMPLAECATCFASVYGSLFYWPVIWLQHGLFRWSYHPNVAALFFWIVFCLSLSVLNTVIAKKFN